jgi:hypothetical protein
MTDKHEKDIKADIDGIQMVIRNAVVTVLICMTMVLGACEDSKEGFKGSTKAKNPLRGEGSKTSETKSSLNDQNADDQASDQTIDQTEDDGGFTEPTNITGTFLTLYTEQLATDADPEAIYGVVMEDFKGDIVTDKDFSFTLGDLSNPEVFGRVEDLTDSKYHAFLVYTGTNALEVNEAASNSTVTAEATVNGESQKAVIQGSKAKPTSKEEKKEEDPELPPPAN